MPASNRSFVESQHPAIPQPVDETETCVGGYRERARGVRDFGGLTWRVT
jgi:hypothetical protein